ncbi:UPF0280 family protein [Candidatus Woesearchaeota archaeon]|nr:UPF0280 family protein [Candidatus Woesearchaeota archaeon]
MKQKCTMKQQFTTHELCRISWEYEETALNIITDRPIPLSALENMKQTIHTTRSDIEQFIFQHREFKESLVPLSYENVQLGTIKHMLQSSSAFGVGPMACVAGIISQIASESLIESGLTLAIVDNGGDIFIKKSPESVLCQSNRYQANLPKYVTVGLYSNSVRHLGLKIELDQTPISLCSSSSLMGRSISLGECDMVTVISEHGSLADAAATATCNRITESDDIMPSLKWGHKPGILGIIAIQNGKIGCIGQVPPFVRTKTQARIEGINFKY